MLGVPTHSLQESMNRMPEKRRTARVGKNPRCVQEDWRKKKQKKKTEKLSGSQKISLNAFNGAERAVCPVKAPFGFFAVGSISEGPVGH